MVVVGVGIGVGIDPYCSRYYRFDLIPRWDVGCLFVKKEMEMENMEMDLSRQFLLSLGWEINFFFRSHQIALKVIVILNSYTVVSCDEKAIECILLHSRIRTLRCMSRIRCQLSL